MVAKTSIAAYWLLGPRAETQKGRIIAYLVEHPGATRRQVAQATGIELGAVAGRMNALVKAKLVREVEGVCPITERPAAFCELAPGVGYDE